MRRRFMLYVVGGTALAHMTFAMALHQVLRWAGAGGWSPWVAVAVALLLVGGLRGRAALLRWDKHISTWRMLLVEEPYYAHWFGALVATPLFALAALVELARWAAGGASPRLGDAALCAYAVGLAVGVWAVFVRRRWVRVRTVVVPVAGLGAAFDGFRIAQMSDLHIGSLCPRSRAERWVDRVGRLDVDMVALTGDYVTSGVLFHLDIAAALTRLRARDGVFAVMGNHDYFGDGEPLITLLREGGVRVLRNEHCELDRGGSKLTIAGVDDTWTKRTDIPKALDGRPSAPPLVVLAHDPKLFLKLAERGAALVLAGHTHWGQVAMPFFATRLNLSGLAMPFTAGAYRVGAATLYVNPGLGTTGPPVRIGAPPEITVLELRAT